jgi:hypothetical protein
LTTAEYHVYLYILTIEYIVSFDNRIPRKGGIIKPRLLTILIAAEKAINKEKHKRRKEKK